MNKLAAKQYESHTKTMFVKVPCKIANFDSVYCYSSVETLHINESFSALELTP